MFDGCERNAVAAQSYENRHNIYLLDDMEGGFVFSEARNRFYDDPPDFHHNIYYR